MPDGINQFINFFGTVSREVTRQFRQNPRLQRTQVSGRGRGLTKSTIAADNIVQSDIVRLKNRAVPLNSKFTQRKRSPRQIRTPAARKAIIKTILITIFTETIKSLTSFSFSFFEELFYLLNLLLYSI